MKTTNCPNCKSENIDSWIIDDDYGHEDEKYRCKDCDHIWYIEGIDY